MTGKGLFEGSIGSLNFYGCTQILSHLLIDIPRFLELNHLLILFFELFASVSHLFDEAPCHFFDFGRQIDLTVLYS